MRSADVLVRERVDEAEAMMDGLALPGTAAHTALRHLQATVDADTAPTRSVLAAGLAALTEQGELALRAGQHALAALRPTDELPHWTTRNAHDWQRYLRWIVATLDRVAAVAGRTESWRRADESCARAREVWGAVAGGATEGSDTRHELTTVIVDGRTDVGVERLAGIELAGLDLAALEPVDPGSTEGT